MTTDPACLVAELSRSNAELELVGARTELVMPRERLKVAERYRSESLVDPLTGFHNRRHLDEILVRTFAAAERGGESVGVIISDLDHLRAAMHRLGASIAELRISASFGVASYPADGRDIAEVLSAADAALYAAKRGGRDRVVEAQRDHDCSGAA